MELQNGFIVGIYNYCDRWCETCPFTSRCRVFADVAEHEAALDPSMKALVDAPPLSADGPDPPAWATDLIEDMNQAAASAEAMTFEPRPVAAAHCALEARARAYGLHVHRWLESREGNDFTDSKDPIAVVQWFSFFIAAKVGRALFGLANDNGDRDWPPDFDGSAKVALIGIERSHAAWIALVEAGRVAATQAVPLVADLVWLGEQLECVFPNARAFVRPAFDEPDEIARLKAGS